MADVLHRNAYAKINLGLRVLRRRPDGYHDINTVFVRIGWADRLEVTPSSKLSFTCSDPSIPSDESNLVLRAIRDFESASGVPIRLAVHLEKYLPHGAGLGGGSSDAGSMLSICAELASTQHQVHVGHDDLSRIASGLGADVPFFLTHGPQVGVATGTDLSPLFDLADSRSLSLPVVVIAPEVYVSSALAYQGLSTREFAEDELMPAEIVRTMRPSEWGGLLANDFEEKVFDAFPQVRRLKDQLLESGAEYASMSGSGSSVFGVYATDEQAQQAAEALRKYTTSPDRMWVGRTI